MISADDASQLVGTIGGTLGLLALAGQIWTDRRQRRLERQLRLKPDHIGASAPPMPEIVEGYMKDGMPWRLRTRIFDGQPSTWSDFPVTMNGCGQRMWTMRWRSIGGAIEVHKVHYNFKDGTPLTEVPAQRGREGLIDGDGCEQPAFILPSDQGVSTLTDIVAEVQFWHYAP